MCTFPLLFLLHFLHFFNNLLSYSEMVAVPSFSLKTSARAQFTTGFTAHEQLFSPKKRNLFRHCSRKLLKFFRKGWFSPCRKYLRVPPEDLDRYLKTTYTVFPSSQIPCFMPTVRLIAQGADGGVRKTCFFSSSLTAHVSAVHAMGGNKMESFSQ